MTEKTEDEILPAGKAVDRIGEKLIEAMRQLTPVRWMLLEICAALADLRRERKEENLDWLRELRAEDLRREWKEKP